MVHANGLDCGGKFLIIHADDVGMRHSVNQATFDALQNGLASSCSIMVPCPWVLEAAHFFVENPNLDHGIHSTFTSEWQFYRWDPLAVRKK